MYKELAKNIALSLTVGAYRYEQGATAILNFSDTVAVMKELIFRGEVDIKCIDIESDELDYDYEYLVTVLFTPKEKSPDLWIEKARIFHNDSYEPRCLHYDVDYLIVREDTDPEVIGACDNPFPVVETV